MTRAMLIGSLRHEPSALFLCPNGPSRESQPFRDEGDQQRAILHAGGSIVVAYATHHQIIDTNFTNSEIGAVKLSVGAVRGSLLRPWKPRCVCGRALRPQSRPSPSVSPISLAAAAHAPDFKKAARRVISISVGHP